jgi:tetratricopeptide (TPR) repeat protein
LVKLAAALFFGTVFAGLGQDARQQIALHASRAQEALRTNQADVAVRELTALLRLDPGNANANANLGVIAFTQGDYAKAAAAFQAALKLQPSLWSAQAFLGVCKVRLGNATNGREILEKAFPHLDTMPLREQAGMQLIQSYSETGELQKALPIVEALARANPNDSETLYTAYRTYAGLAAAALQSLAKTAPDSPRIHEVLAQNYMSQENYPAAIAEYRKALQAGPQLAGLHFELGQAILAKSQSEEARSEAEKEFLAELARNPADANSSYELGEIAYHRSDLKTAHRRYARAIEMRPRFVEARIALGKVLATQGQWQEVLEQLSEAVRLEPENKVAHYRLVQVYRQLGRPADAERERKVFERLHAAEAAGRTRIEQMTPTSVHAQTIDPEH